MNTKILKFVVPVGLPCIDKTHKNKQEQKRYWQKIVLKLVGGGCGSSCDIAFGLWPRLWFVTAAVAVALQNHTPILVRVAFH